LRMISGKEFKKRFLHYVGKHPYAWAERNGISKGVIIKINKEKFPDVDNLVKISNILNVSIDHLLADGEHTGKEKKPSVSEKSEINLPTEANDPESGVYVKKLLNILQCNHEGFRNNIRSFVDVLYNLWIISQQQTNNLTRKRNEEDRSLREIVDLLKNHPCHKEATLTYIQQLIKHQEVLKRIEKYKANYETKSKKNTSENDQMDKLLGEIASKENAGVLLDIFEDIVKKSGTPSPSQKKIPGKD